VASTSRPTKRQTLAVAIVVAIVALMAGAFYLGPSWALSWGRSRALAEEARLQSLAAQARARSTVAFADAWEDSGQREITVMLVPTATDRDARDLYCDLIVPSGWVADSLVVRGEDYWVEPEDCSDPNDVPRAMSGGPSPWWTDPFYFSPAE
jgi:hypothetical protein